MAVLLLSDLRDPLVADALDLGGRKGGFSDDIGHQRQRRHQVAAQRVERHKSRIEPRPHVDAGAQPLLLLGDRNRVAAFGALVEHRRHEALRAARVGRSEEHTSELQSLMRISYAVFCLKKKNNSKANTLSPYAHIDTETTDRTT